MLFANFRVDVIYAVWLCYGTEACCFVSEHRKQFAPLKMLLVSDSKRAPSPFAPEQGSSASTHGIITLCPRKLYYLKNKQTKKPLQFVCHYTLPPNTNIFDIHSLGKRCIFLLLWNIKRKDWAVDNTASQILQTKQI